MNEQNPLPTTRGDNWLKRNWLSLLTLVLICALTVAIFVLYNFYPENFSQLKGYGYLGVFLISLLFNATLILPIGSFVIIAALGAALPLPLLVGLAGGTGAAIGELTGYFAGFSGREIFNRGKTYLRIEGWVRRWGFLAVFLLSAAPVIFDLAGLAAGILRMRFWRFLLACWLGRIIFYTLIAYAGFWSWESIIRCFG